MKNAMRAFIHAFILIVCFSYTVFAEDDGRSVKALSDQAGLTYIPILQGDYRFWGESGSEDSSNLESGKLRYVLDMSGVNVFDLSSDDENNANIYKSNDLHGTRIFLNLEFDGNGKPELNVDSLQSVLNVKEPAQVTENDTSYVVFGENINIYKSEGQVFIIGSDTSNDVYQSGGSFFAAVDGVEDPLFLCDADECTNEDVRIFQVDQVHTPQGAQDGSQYLQLNLTADPNDLIANPVDLDGDDMFSWIQANSEDVNDVKLTYSYLSDVMNSDGNHPGAFIWFDEIGGMHVYFSKIMYNNMVVQGHFSPDPSTGKLIADGDINVADPNDDLNGTWVHSRWNTETGTLIGEGTITFEENNITARTWSGCTNPGGELNMVGSGKHVVSLDGSVSGNHYCYCTGTYSIPYAMNMRLFILPEGIDFYLGTSTGQYSGGNTTYYEVGIKQNKE